MEEFISYISNIGFPIALSIYLLTRLEVKMDKLTESIDKLSQAIKE